MRSVGGTAALGAGLAGAGVAFGSPSLIVAGFALVVLAVVAFVWVELAVRGASIEVEPGRPRRIVEGDTYPLSLRLERGAVFPPGGEVRHTLLDAPVRTGPFGPSRIEIEIRMPRRGRHVLENTIWEFSDPLSLRTRRREAGGSGELLVLPRIEAVDVMGPASVDGDGAGAANAGEEGAASIREARAVEFEVDGLRPYRHGSPASRIHWPAVARSGEMHERRIVAGAEATPLVALDAEHPASEEDLDKAVRAAASLCVHLARRSGCAVLLPGSHGTALLDARLRNWPALHARFAVVGAGAATRLPSRSSGVRGSVFWVTARAPGQIALPRSIGSGSHFVVSPFGSASPAAFEVAGCAGVTAGTTARERVAA